MQFIISLNVTVNSANIQVAYEVGCETRGHSIQNNNNVDDDGGDELCHV